MNGDEKAETPPNGQDITLVCSRCGKKSQPMTGAPVQFATDLMPYAEHAGFVWAHDPCYNRVLIFCSDECDQAARTKKGWYKRYPNKG